MKPPIYREIIKAEVLFSRQCPLSCSYCAMKSDKQNNRSIAEWCDGMMNLKALGCEFVAFYGAEPLTEYLKLREVIAYTENTLGMDTTIITSGAVPDFYDKLLDLNSCGARSLSMSYDPAPIDNSSKIKSDLAIEALQFFKKLPNCRDVAAIATLTSQNFRVFPTMVKEMTELGIWSFFDFIHTDRGFTGSKCSTVAKERLISKRDFGELAYMLLELLALKKEGMLCHTTEHFIDTMKDLMIHGDIYKWSCKFQDPSWVTIDCDGKVYPCDDFTGVHTPIDMTYLFAKWEDFCDERTLAVTKENCRCCWNTHIDAHGIASGKVDISNYVHGNRN